MNYEEMSDFEINKEVALIKNNNLIFTEDDRVYLDTDDDSLVDYCNNPSDAWPIIESIWCDLMRPPYRGHGTAWERLVSENRCGKLRAAMICFLNMKDAENGKH